MTEIDTALAASRDAVEQLIRAGEQSGAAWTAPRAPGKWSPSQIVEHVARGLDEAVNIVAGRPTLPTPPGHCPADCPFHVQAGAAEGGISEGL